MEDAHKKIPRVLAYTNTNDIDVCVCTPSLSSREFSPGPPDGSITKIQKGEDQPSIASGHQCQPRPKEEAEKVTYKIERFSFHQWR